MGNNEGGPVIRWAVIGEDAMWTVMGECNNVCAAVGEIEAAMWAVLVGNAGRELQ